MFKFISYLKHIYNDLYTIFIHWPYKQYIDLYSFC